MKDLPSGTVTFLFTDIEGSTKLLEQLGDEYADLLTQQRELLRETFSAYDGQEVDTQGDAFFYSFARARAAVQAAAEAQRKLARQAWPGDVELRVRMGLHTGEPLHGEEGYVGMDVHRAARIASTGHGGQVLLSSSTTALIEQDLPEGLQLIRLGEHRLKDLQHRQHLCQLAGPDLRSSFPPLKSLDALPNNLPPQLNSFIGREDELRAIQELIGQSRLVTLVGPGGAGKTRLSLQVAAEMVDHFQHGAWLIELAPLVTEDEITPAIASALGLSLDSFTTTLEPKWQLLDYLAHRDCLLVMDNFEHLLQSAELMVELLQQAPQLHLLVTSRERLNLKEEWIYEVGGLTYPTNGRQEAEVYSALELFKTRAVQVRNDFSLTKTVEPAVVHICKLTEGSPLGLELAASWVAAMPPQAIVEQIEQNIDFLSTRMKDVPARHRSLRAVFNHSWDLLSDPQREGFQRLSVFRGGFSREAAQGAADVDLHMLAEFVDKSLVRQSGENRYQVHEQLRQFAQECLQEDSAKALKVREQHSRYYAGLLHHHRHGLDRSPLLELRVLLRPDINNLKEAICHACLAWETIEARGFLYDYGAFYRALSYHEGLDALRYLITRLEQEGFSSAPERPRSDVMLALNMLIAVFEASLGLTDSEELVQQSLQRLREPGNGFELSLCLLALGIYHCFSSEYSLAVDYLSESLVAMQPFQDLFGEATVLSWMGWAYYEMGDQENAGKIFQQGYDLCVREDSPLGQAYTLSKLGTWADAEGEFAKAMEYHQEAQRIFIEFNDLAGQGYALSRMSMTAWRMGDYANASKYGEQGLICFEEINHRWGVTTSHCRIGFAEVGSKDMDAAEQRLKQAIELAIEGQFPAQVSYALIGLAAIRIADEQFETALQCLGYAKAQTTTPSLYKLFADMELEKVTDHLDRDQIESHMKHGAQTELEALLRKICA